MAAATNPAAGKPRDLEFWRGLGCGLAGPALHVFVSWLIREAEALRLPHIYFFSREGDILLQAYQLLAAGRSHAVPASYLYASRRALNFAAIEKMDGPALALLSEGSSCLTAAHYLRRWGLDPAAHSGLIRQAGLAGPGQIIRSRKDKAGLRSLFEALGEIILSQARSERESYLSYLDQEGAARRECFGVADIGWRASMQQSLARILLPRQPRLRIEGFYLGLCRRAAPADEPHNGLRGCLLHLGQPERNYFILRHCVELAELLFASPEKSLIRMQLENGHAVPVFEEQHELAECLPGIKAMREGALDFIENAKESPPEINAQSVMTDLKRLLTQPAQAELDILGNLSFADTFGERPPRRFLARPAPFIENILHPLKMKAEYRRSFWRKGFYLRLSFPERLLLRIIMPRLAFSRMES